MRIRKSRSYSLELWEWALSPRKFDLICIVILVAVTAVAMVLVSTSPGGSSVNLPKVDMGTSDIGSNTTMPFGIQPMSLNLALAIVADVSLMTLGLVILFQDGSPGRRYRAR